MPFVHLSKPIGRLCGGLYAFATWNQRKVVMVVLGSFKILNCITWKNATIICLLFLISIVICIILSRNIIEVISIDYAQEYIKLLQHNAVILVETCFLPMNRNVFCTFRRPNNVRFVFI